MVVVSLPLVALHQTPDLVALFGAILMNNRCKNFADCVQIVAAFMQRKKLVRWQKNIAIVALNNDKKLVWRYKAVEWTLHVARGQIQLPYLPFLV